MWTNTNIILYHCLSFQTTVGCFVEAASSRSFSSAKKRSSLSNISYPQFWTKGRFSKKNIKWRKLYFEILSGLFGGGSNIEISTWSIIFPGAVSSQLWMIEYSRTNIKFKSLDLMDLVINLSDGIFSAFQTSWRKILGSFLQNYVFFRLLLLSTRLTSFAENHDSLQRRPLCTLMKPLLLDYAKFMVKIYMFFFYGCLHYLCAYNVGIIIFLIC